MKERKNSDSHRDGSWQMMYAVLRVLCVLSISIFSFSCDKPVMVVESTDQSDQAFSVTASPLNDLDRSRLSGSAAPEKNNSPDSSLIIISERSDSLLRDSLIITETFNLSLIHKLSSDSTLDYGNVKFGNVQLNRMGGQFSKWVSWSYIAQQNNNQTNSVYAQWEEACNLQQPPLISISQSPVVKDSTQLLSTVVPVKIVNLQTGGMVNTEYDLEIVFNRNLQKGAVFSIGSDSAQRYYHFELLRSASKLTIPAKYIQAIKGSSSTVKCQVLLKENLFIGVLTSEAQTGRTYYRLPMYEIVKHSITATLY